MKEKYEHIRHITTYECDQNKLIKISGLVQQMQEAGRMQMERDRPAYEDIQEHGKALMLSRLDLEIYDELYVGEEVIVSSWACEASRATFPRCYDIHRGEDIIAEITSQWALVDIETRRVLKTDEMDFSAYYMGVYKELHVDKFRIPKDTELEEVEKHLVRYSDLDSNGHMNNTYYLDMLCDLIPELEWGKHRVKSLRIHYSKEATLGDIITIYRAVIGPGLYAFRTVKPNGETNIEAEISVIEL